MVRFFTLFSLLVLALCFSSIRLVAQDCTGFNPGPVGGGLTLIDNGEICANLGGAPGSLRIDATNVNDINGAVIAFEIDWNDGSALQTVAATPAATPHSYTSTRTHLFPPNGPNVKCVYRPTVRLVVNGVVCPGTLGTPPEFVRWNTDNQNTGVLRLSETTTSVVEYLVCRGTETTVTFSDRSTINCIPATLSTKNSTRRWRRYVYGTANTITSATGVKVANVVQTYPFVPPGPPAQTGPGPGITAGPIPSATLNITIPADAQVGQIFEITMDYWNYCNPYVAPGVSPAPVQTTARIRIVEQPTPPPVVNNVICNGTTPLPAFTTTVPGNPGVILWYRNVPGATPALDAPGALITNPNGAASKTLPASAYPGGITPTVAGVYKVWVSYQAVNNPDNKTCESPKVPVTLTIREGLTSPPSIPAVDICDNQNQTYTLSGGAPTPTTIGGATVYDWDFSGGPGVSIVSTSGASATYNFDIPDPFVSVTRTVGVLRRYTTTPQCATTKVTQDLTIFNSTVAGSVAGGGNFCQGANVGNLVLSGHRGSIVRWEVSVNGGAFADAGLPTTTTVSLGSLTTGNYLYRAVVANGPCSQQITANVAINVSPNPGSPVNAGADQSLCTTVLQSAPIGASDPSPGTGQWTVMSGPAGAVTNFVDGATNRNTRFASDLRGAYTLRWRVSSGSCTFDDFVNIDFGSDPGVQNAGPDDAVCGKTYTLGATPPTIGQGTWTHTGGPVGGTVTFSDVNSPTSTVTLAGAEVFGATAYVFTWTVRSGTCTPRTDAVSIRFSRPGTATVTAMGNQCVDGTTLAPITLTPGTVGGGSTSGRWEIVSGSGTFTSNNANPGQTKTGPSIAESYKPSAADFTAGSAQLRLVAIDPDGALPCTNVNSTTLTVNFDRVPTNVNAGVDQPLLCGPSTTLAASVPVNGTGHWENPNAVAGVSFVNINDRNTVVNGLPVGATTLRWRVTSASGTCSSVFDDVVVTRNALPTVNNLTPQVCELTAGGGTANNIVLTLNDNAVTGGAANTSVAWFTDPVPAGPISPASTPQNLSNAAPNSLTFFTRVTNSVTTCQNTGTVTYQINPLPVASPFSKAFCEEFPVGSNKVDNINLNAADIVAGVTGGAAGRTITWWLDAAATAQPIATPNAFSIVGSKVVYARVRNTATTCENVAQVDLTIKARPFDQPIQGKAAVCVNALELYQVNAVTGATYQWTIPPQFTKFLGGDPTDFLSLVSFPGVATGDIKLKISVNGCEGNELVKSVAVSPTPAAFTINVPASAICENEIGVPFSVTPNNYPSSNYNWEIDPAGAALVSTGQTTGNVLINFLTSDITIKVTESNASNCAGPPQQTTVTVRKRPTLASLSAEVCSDDVAGIVLSSDALSAVPATSFNLISVAIDPGIIPKNVTAVGNIAANALANNVFENTTGGALRVRYTIEPVSADGCPGPAKIVQLTVKPEPLLDITTPSPVCSNKALARVLTVVSGSVPADFFIIESVTPQAGLTAIAGTPTTLGTFDKNVLVDDVWQNQTSNPLTVTYMISPLNSTTSCVGTPSLPLVFTIYPEPLVSPTSGTVCSGDAASVALTSSNVTNVNFSWTVKSASAGITGADAGTGTTINDILTNTSGSAGTVVYTVTAKNPAGFLNCEGPGQDVTVTVNPAPAVTNITQTVCSDVAGTNTIVRDLLSFQNTINSGAGLTFTWYTDSDLDPSHEITSGLTAYTLTSNVSVYAKVDNGTCSNMATVTFIVNPTPSVTAAATLYNGFGVRCAGDTDGQIIATANSGTSPYLFSINATDFFSSGSFNALSPASYTITVKDNKNCLATSSPVSIIAPPALTISGVAADALCKGGMGSITINSGGGVTGTHQYSLNGGAFQTSNIFTVSAGTYTIAVKDANNCQRSTSVTVGESTAIVPSIASQVNVNCNGESNASVTLAATGGNGPYEFAVAPAGTFQASPTFGTLAAGNYVFTVRDANSCTTTINVIITQPAVLTLNLSVKTDVDCNGNNTGSLTMVGFGGTTPYQFSKDNGANFQSSASFTGLTAATYPMLVRDAHGCTASLNVTINQPLPLTGTITSQTNVLCNGTNTGSVTVNGSGGSGTYQFSINGGAFGSSPTFTDLIAGAYTVTIKDQSNCTFDVPVTITEPTVLSGGANILSQVSCNGGSDGSAEITSTGGVGPYQYSINGGSNFVSSGIFNGLTAGNYTVIIRDANSCTFNVPFTITEPTLLVGTIADQTPVDCRGNSTGSVDVDAQGGTAPYQFSIDGSTFQPTGSFTGLAAGTYIVRIRDDKNCTRNVNITIVEPTQLLLAVQSQVNVDCNGNSTGSVVLQASGGVGGYTFSSDNATFGASNTFGALAAGAHTFFVRDANNCTAQVVANITEPTVLMLTMPGMPTAVMCNGQSTGVITVQGSGGAGSYEYSKDGVNFTPLNVFSGLAAGNYTITVRDANQCTTSIPATITEPPALTATRSQIADVSCFQEDDGAIEVTASGGSAPLTYLLLQDPSNTTGQSSGTFTGIRAGTYTVRVTDVNNCSIVTTPITITQPTQLKVTSVVTSNFNGFQLSCDNASDGVIQASTTGGTGPTFTFSIDPDPNSASGNTTGLFTNLPAGFYTVRATDVNGCPAEAIPILINPPFPFSAGFIGFDQFVCAGNDPGVINSIVSPFGGTQDYLFQWQESADNVLFTDIPGANGITYDPPATLIQTTFYKRVVSLATGTCTPLESNVVKVTINPLPTVAIAADPEKVCQGGILFVNLTFTGQAPFRYDYTSTDLTGTQTHNDQIGGAQTPIPIFNYQETTTFRVTRVRDFNGCQIQPTTIQVEVPVIKIDANFAVNPTGQCSGRSFDVTWNVQPNVKYTFNWGDGPVTTINSNSLPVGPATISHTYNFPVAGGSTFIPIILSAQGEDPTLPADKQCEKQSTRTIEIFPSVIVSVPLNKNVLCSGETLLFDNLTIGASTHKWYYRVKGTTDQLEVKTDYKPSYTFVNNTTSNPIVYEVVYEGSNATGCEGSTTLDITVYRNAIASFTNSTPPPFVAGVSAFTYENTSSILDGVDFRYSWNFGVDATPPDLADDDRQFIPVSYSSAGSKNVSLTVMNRLNPACQSSIVQSVLIVIPPLTANFKVKPMASCVPTTLTVENSASAANKFEWVLRNEAGITVAASNVINPSFDITSAGTYSLELTATLTTTNQTATFTKEDIFVFPVPQAIFVARPDKFFVPDTEVRFVNNSDGASAYEWSFGDGETSIEEYPIHKYLLEGNYTILLRATQDHGLHDVDDDPSTPDVSVVCADTTEQTVIAREGGSTKIPNAFTPSTKGPSGGLTTDENADNNDVFLPRATAGVQEYLLQIFDRWGNLIFESKDKDIGWDGYKDGRLLPAGVYVYKLVMRLADDQRETRIGDVTMIR